MGPAMALCVYALSALGAFLEGLLLFRLFQRGLFKRYPFFSAFVLYDFLRTLVVAGLSHFWPRLYAPLYWYTEMLALAFLVAIIWEIERSIFVTRPGLTRVAKESLLAVGVLFVPAVIGLSWSQASVFRYPYEIVSPLFEQYLTVTLALLLLCIAGLARYYRVRLGKNMRGLIFGLGLYLSLYALNFAGLQFIQGFLRYWQILSPVAYIGLAAFWLWSFWEFAPAPEPPSQLVDSHSKEVWNELWTATTGAIRRGQN